MDINKIKDYFKRLSDDDLRDCLYAAKNEYHHRNDVRKTEAVKDLVKAWNKLQYLFKQDENEAFISFKEDGYTNGDEWTIEITDVCPLNENSVMWR